MKRSYQLVLGLFGMIWLVLAMPATAQDDRPLKASGVQTGIDLGLNAAKSAEHTTLFQLLKASGLLKQAHEAGPYTVFAPTNAAFFQLPDGFLNELLLPSSKNRLIRFLAYHVVKGRLTSDQLRDGQTLTNLSGQTLVIHKQGSTMTITDGRDTVAEVIQGDVQASNGVVYSINRVLQRAINEGPIVR